MTFGSWIYRDFSKNIPGKTYLAEINLISLSEYQYKKDHCCSLILKCELFSKWQVIEIFDLYKNSELSNASEWILRFLYKNIKWFGNERKKNNRNFLFSSASYFTTCRQIHQSISSHLSRKEIISKNIAVINDPFILFSFRGRQKTDITKILLDCWKTIIGIQKFIW